MKTVITQNYYVINSTNVDFISSKAVETLKKEADFLLNQINLESHKDWTIHFQVIYGDKPEIWIYTSMPSYKDHKQKPITIHIPLPTDNIVEWGLNLSKFVKVGMPTDKGFTKLEVNFKQFKNREEYLIDCMRRAILTCFKNGFTMDGKKLKLKLKDVD
jgi:hypothetical protein